MTTPDADARPPCTPSTPGRSENGLDAEKEYWNIANVVTGFAVAQALAFLYALGGPLNHLLGLSPLARSGLAFLIVISGAVYCKWVWECRRSVLTTDNVELWARVTRWRIWAILIFTLFSAGVLLGLEPWTSHGGPQAAPPHAQPAPHP